MKDKILKKQLNKKYEAGFTTNVKSETLPPGLNENVIKQISSAINSVVQAFKHLKDFSKFMLGMMPGQIFGGDIESGNDSLKKQSNNSSSNSQNLSSISNTSSTVTNIYTNATAHGINNALGTRGDNISRGARIGMNLAKGNLTGGYGNLSMTRAR